MSIQYKDGVLLEELTKNLSYLKTHNLSPRTTITSLARDSRRVKPGALFVAIPGYHEDGHQYIQEAIERGAAAIVSERESFAGHLPYFQVQDSRKALSLLSSSFYQEPSKDLFLLGITGTNGKTTTAFMAYSIFKEEGVGTGLLGTVLMDDGKQISKAQLTTPDSLDLQKALYRMRENQIEAAVMEVSSQGLEQERVFGMDFDIGIFTNLTTEHLGFHQDFNSYRRAKAKFIDLLKGEKKRLLYNRDDDRVCELIRGRSQQIYSFSLKGEGDFNGELLTISRDGISCILHFLGEERVELSLQLLGRHSLYNALSAAAAAYLEGISLVSIKRALEAFQPVTRRLELHEREGILILDDTALNPASYQVVFETIENLDYDDLILVNAIRGKRGTAINRENARVLREWAQRIHLKKIIITSSKEYTSPLDMVEKEEEESFLQELYPLSYLFYSQLSPAIEAALEETEEGDLLLLLGAQGMDHGAEILFQEKFPQKEGKQLHLKK